MSTDKDPLLQALGAVVRRTRLARRLTIEGLARKQPFTASYIHHVEHAESNTSVLKLAALAKALNIDLEQLFGEAEWEMREAYADLPAIAAETTAQLAQWNAERQHQPPTARVELHGLPARLLIAWRWLRGRFTRDPIERLIAEGRLARPRNRKSKGRLPLPLPPAANPDNNEGSK